MDYHPRLWGSSAWTFMEYIALGYPDIPTEEDKKHYKELYYNLEYTIPCKECRINYSLHIEETPIDFYLKNSYSLYEWVIIIKNKVNRILNKPRDNHEQKRQQNFKRNIMMTSNTPCCGNKQGKTETVKDHKIRLEGLQKDVRAKKNELRKVKILRDLKKKKRKG